MSRRTRQAGALAALAATALLAAGCHTDMWEQPKVKPLRQNAFFADQRGSRTPPAGTVPQGRRVQEDPLLWTGAVSGKRTQVLIRSGAPVQTGIFRGTHSDRFPFPIGRSDLVRGRDQYDVFCAPCHGRVGDGKGMIALRGMAQRRAPANYHIDRLRRAPVGHFYDVATNGYGIMYGYAERIPDPADRWRIAAWIRVLQESQNAPADAVPAAERTRLDGAAPAESEGTR